MDGVVRCQMHTGGTIEVNEGVVGYKGGRSKIIQVHRSVDYSELAKTVYEKMNLSMTSHSIHFTMKEDPLTLFSLDDDDDVNQMFSLNDSWIRIYFKAKTIEDGNPTTQSMVISNQVCAPGSSEGLLDINPVAVVDECDVNDSRGLVRGCIENDGRALECARWSTTIMGSGQIFQSANEFRDAVYLMSIAGRFKYIFTRNRREAMTVNCKIDGCPWKVTCRRVGDTKIVQVHTFNNLHRHTLDDVGMIEPDVKAKHAGALIDEVIRGTPEYLPTQICKDFTRSHGIQMSYHQAWNMKEKANNRIFGLPKNSYKLLPWVCEQIRRNNSWSHVKLTHHDGRFKQLFLAHGFSIHGFQLGCRPIISVDSCHLSGPYGGALFSATAYDANDGIFPLAIGIMGGENYEDWFWFLENLKQVVGSMEVVIISDRHPGLLTAIPELFGKDNHAYCYRHLKENFSSFFTKRNVKGRKGKKNALRLLDSIAYARLEADYVAAVNEMYKFNPDLGRWVESNNPEHWAMSKFTKKRWDKMSSSIAESVNAWLKTERHHSICSFIIEHMIKLAGILNRHKEEAEKWEGVIGPRIEKQLNDNIQRSASLSVAEFFQGNFLVCCGGVNIRVNLIQRQCSCKEWEMVGIPCAHACAAIRKVDQNPLLYVDDWYSYLKQKMIFSGEFAPIETYNMPTVDKDGEVRDVTGDIIFSLKPPAVKRRPGRPKKKRKESQFQDKQTIHCSRCRQPGHNRKSCINPPVDDDVS